MTASLPTKPARMSVQQEKAYRLGYAAGSSDARNSLIPREPTESMIKAMISADADSNYGYETEAAEKYLARLYRAAWDAAYRINSLSEWYRMNKKSDQDLMVITDALRELVRYVQRLHNHEVPEGRVSTELIDALIILGKIDKVEP